MGLNAPPERTRNMPDPIIIVPPLF